MEEISWKKIENKISAGQAHLLTTKILKDFPYENTGNEFKIPPWSNILQLSNVISILVFYLFFRYWSIKVKRHLWKEIVGFRQYRLQNLTVSLIHSVISAACALHFAYFYTEAMFEQPMHWYQHWATYGLLFSLGYFFHDMQDVLQNENSFITIKFTLLHHLSSSFAFVTAITSRKFVPFAYCALIMETNSIFLHIRALMTLSKSSSKHYIFYKFNQVINVITFVGCRFGIQAWQIYWVYKHHNSMHLFFALFGYIGGIVFYIINGILFLRIIAVDGMLGNFGYKHVHKYREDNDSAEKST
uniref:TLC domain-containing protein n=1 Tax=Panagrolaimus sp. ES5 TaxID=591445 RepID=A0AC34FCX9_9BILA